MRKKNVQMSLFDIYNDVSEAVENKKPKVISLLEEHIDFENIIKCTVRTFYYKCSLKARVFRHFLRKT